MLLAMSLLKPCITDCFFGVSNFSLYNLKKLWCCGVWWKTRVRGYAGMRICRYAGMRICGYADMRVRRTGLTNRFQKLINSSNKIIAVNTKNHSCEGVFICGKTHVDFHKTLTSIFSAYTTSIY